MNSVRVFSQITSLVNISGEFGSLGIKIRPQVDRRSQQCWLGTAALDVSQAVKINGMASRLRLCVQTSVKSLRDVAAYTSPGLQMKKVLTIACSSV